LILAACRSRADARRSTRGSGAVNPGHDRSRGPFEVWETGFSGVWRVRHFDATKIIVDLVEIASIPEILRSDGDAKLAAQS